MATVKSLEERIDEMTDDVSDMKSMMAAQGVQISNLISGQAMLQAQIGALVNGLATIQSQLAITTARLDSAIDNLNHTNARLDGASQELKTLTRDFSEYRGRVETVIGTSKWFGAFVATVFVSVVATGFYVARSAGSLDATVQQQQKTLDEIKREVVDIRGKLNK